MPRWRQDPVTLELILIEESTGPRAPRVAIFNDLPSFRSPVDGSIISDRGQMREHNKRNDVVCAQEFSDSYFEGKAKERADFYQGKSTKYKAERIDDLLRAYHVQEHKR